MTDEQKAFMEKHFKAGEYSVLTIMVNNAELKGLIDALQNSGLNLAILPDARAKIDFATDEGVEE